MKVHAIAIDKENVRINAACRGIDEGWIDGAGVNDRVVIISYYEWIRLDSHANPLARVNDCGLSVRERLQRCLSNRHPAKGNVAREGGSGLIRGPGFGFSVSGFWRILTDTFRGQQYLHGLRILAQI